MYGPGGFCASVTAPPSGSFEPLLIDAAAVPINVVATVTFWQMAIGGGSNTVIVNVCGALVSAPPFAVPPLSCNWTVQWATPTAPLAAVNVNVPFGAIAGAAEKSAPLSLPTMKFKVCPTSSAGPALMLVAHPGTDWAPAFFCTERSDPLVNVGASFTDVTVMVNVFGAQESAPPFAVPPSSWIRTVTVADPLTLAAVV